VPIPKNDKAARPQPLPVPSAKAFDRLARLHVETSETGRLVVFLRAALNAASLFLLMGTCVLFLGGGATIAHNFAWAALMLIGIAALLYSYIRTNAAVFDRAPITESARNLRLIFLYMGLAWGAGAFLAVPATLSWLTAVLFAVIPTLLLVLLLHDGAAAAAFLVPAGLLTAACAFLHAWPHPMFDTLLILGLQWASFLGIVWRRRTSFPAGLALR
jgi:hypothetical protein